MGQYGLIYLLQWKWSYARHVTQRGLVVGLHVTAYHSATGIHVLCLWDPMLALTNWHLSSNVRSDDTHTSSADLQLNLPWPWRCLHRYLPRFQRRGRFASRNVGSWGFSEKCSSHSKLWELTALQKLKSWFLTLHVEFVYDSIIIVMHHLATSVCLDPSQLPLSSICNTTPFIDPEANKVWGGFWAR